MREREISAFLAASAEALARCTGPAAGLASEVTARMARSASEAAPPPAATWMPVCDLIAPALADNPSPLAAAFAALAPRLPWGRRASARPEDGAFWDGHANAILLGPGGFEARDDLWIGASLIAPGVSYPEHSHPPAEVYLPLTPGEWWNADMDWTDPGLGGFMYNPPGIRHAMRAGAGPFLALWFLPL